MLEARSDRSSSTGGRREALASRLVFLLNPRAFSRGLESRDTYREERGYWRRGEEKEETFSIGSQFILDLGDKGNSVFTRCANTTWTILMNFRNERTLFKEFAPFLCSCIIETTMLVS